jgi:hypothetical protein
MANNPIDGFVYLSMKSKQLIVSPIVYSGRPNPIWVVEGDEAEMLLSLCISSKDVLQATQDDRSGFTGFRIKGDKEEFFLTLELLEAVSSHRVGFNSIELNSLVNSMMFLLAKNSPNELPDMILHRLPTSIKNLLLFYHGTLQSERLELA